MPQTAKSLYQTLHRLIRLMHRRAHYRKRMQGGLYHGQATLLRLAAQKDGAIQRDLAVEMDVRPSSMTEMLTRLEMNGMVVRRQDESDQRVTRIFITEEGKKLAEQMNAAADMEDIFDVLSSEEKHQLLAILEKLCLSLESLES
jgi:DNA-binding MarR family transcriptional regulator